MQSGAPLASPEGGIGLAPRFLFFVVAPVIVSCIETFLQIAVADEFDLGVSLLFALLFTVPGTFTAWLMTTLIARLPGTDRLPLALLLMLGFATSLIVFRPFNRLIYDLIPLAAPHLARTSSLAEAPLVDTVLRFLLINVPGLFIWTGLNLLFISTLRYPVYRPPHAAAPALPPFDSPQATVLPDFCRTAGIEDLADLWAISAEEHYLRLRGRFGTRMIRHSFGAALDQLPPGHGLRVHRSHWVAFGRVARIEPGKTVQLLLADGTAIPVSSSYRQAVLLTEAALTGR
ncbi:LytTR family DNA-binding domain-containing protein [Polymorphobacter sp.]|uniref:LytTR family DNA-binding domain-containing protein n=1 Tax=Polymorphobacter sp. TaxID=1909290 RepID=UPI003F713F84